jgi:methylenetetrahydrofolate dehydrogenase (NADP+) / methenyltetrahydrofolate cyclohydrolase / formyltetrahydrofolate synthetase
VVVAINRFYTDTDAELELVKQACLESGKVFDAVVTNHWEEGGAGSIELGKAVIKAAEQKTNSSSSIRWISPSKRKLKPSLKRCTAQMASIIHQKQKSKLKNIPAWALTKLPICMAKTHLSLSHDPTLKGRPKGYRIPIRSVNASVGAGFLYPLLGTMSTMPGLPTRPAYYDIDIDLETGRIVGLS